MDECGKDEAAIVDPVPESGLFNENTSGGSVPLASECGESPSNEQLQGLIKEQMSKMALLTSGQNLRLRRELAQLQSKNAELERQLRTEAAAFQNQAKTCPQQNVYQAPAARVAAPVTQLPSRISSELPTNVTPQEIAQGQGQSPKSKALGQVDRIISTHNRRVATELVSGHSSRGSSRGESSDESAYSLESRDKKRGKTKKCRDRANTHDNCCGHVRQENLVSKQSSGLKDQLAHKIINKQRYPQAALQHEYLWDWAGVGVEYKDLSLGLFVAGELEIISSPDTDPIEATRRLELLKITSYRAQYIAWPKLLHLHAAILRKIETGHASWSSNFDKIEKMVLENPGKIDWGSRLGIEGSNRPRGPRDRKGGAAGGSAQVLWCGDFQLGSCSKASPNHA